MTTNEVVTLRDFMDVKFSSLANDVARLQVQMDSMQGQLNAGRTDSESVLEDAKIDIERRFEKIEGRLDGINTTLIRYGTIVTVASPVVLALLYEIIKHLSFG